MSDRQPVPRRPDLADSGEPKTPDDVDETVELSARLRTLHEQRLVDEREAAMLPSLLRAIASTRRDCDGKTSRKLRAHREQLERVWAETEDLLVTAARTALQAQQRGGNADDPLIRRAQRAIDASVQAVRQLSHDLEQTP
jgi:hypothetical protein